VATRPPCLALPSQPQVLVARRKPGRNELVMNTYASFVAPIISGVAGLCFAAGLCSVAG
jgi:hypothetical protein